jgi:Ser/Thr protein kinase RdoA (MazF antagonist)
VTLADGENKILRIHRTGYHSLAAIRSEHRWMAALRDEARVRTPELLRAGDDTEILHIVTDDLPEGRDCVFFEYLEGAEPDSEDLLGNFPNLGEVTARMHQHAIGWQLPKGFERFTWDLDSIFGEQPHWGHWHDSPWVDRASEPVLSRLVDTLKARLLRFGCGPDRFGLVHADMRLANLLVHDGETRVIDFDDCGFSWFLYDLATALTFMEDRADVMELVDAWLTGYQRVRSLSGEEIAEIPTFLMLRRMLALTWLGSHSETELGQEVGPEFTRTSVDLAEELALRTAN